jgi:hypothetical protein
VKLAKKASNLPDNTAPADKNALPERHRFLPDNLAATSEKAYSECCSLLLWQISSVTPYYEADTIR